jgi:hypothetical protein
MKIQKMVGFLSDGDCALIECVRDFTEYEAPIDAGHIARKDELISGERRNEQDWRGKSVVGACRIGR